MGKKKTGRTIKEKAARMPEIREVKWDRIIPDYLKSVKAQSSESAKSQRFLLLLNEFFGVQPGFIEEYVSGIEKYVKVKQKDRILKGRIDDLFGNLVIEFERDLTKKREEAEDQLKKYIACLWSQEPPQRRAPYLCIASDGINFAVYSPIIPDAIKKEIQPEEVHLRLIEQVDLQILKPPQEVYFWLDRYFLRKEPYHPKTEEIIKDFGIQSHAFQIALTELTSLWRSLKGKSKFSVIYESWEKYLRIVYGTSVAEDELFCRHTYLATLAKLITWSRLSESKGSPDDIQILSVLEGQFFKDQGIENFLEEDFFSWIVRGEAKDTGIETARRLLSLLRNYNLKELSEDVLKSLYQELVDPKTRHDLGEFYTPDWLAHMMVQKLMEQNKEGSFLDPACGSGTFLYLTIKEKRDRLSVTRKTLKHILTSVFGVDIHPLAVIIAKTNYILALGGLLQKRKGKISIPIYLSDTIRLPERWMQTKGAQYQVIIDGKTIYLPENLLKNPALYDEAIDATREFAVQNIGKKVTESHFLNFIETQNPNLTKDRDAFQNLFHIAEILKEFIEHNKDTIWAFVLKNIYKPLFLKGKFDFVIGNPPWLAFGYAEPQYQKFLKEQILKVYSLLSRRGGQVVILSHLELGTLFLLRTADLYLKEGGIIAFVLPRSIFTADQHDGLRLGTFKNVTIEFLEVWDMEGVTPLFNVPSCVLMAKRQEKAKVFYPISGQKLSGEIPRRNASLNEAEEYLTIEDAEINLHRRGVHSFWAKGPSKISKESFYRKHFCQGAFIVPRSLWFVEVKASTLGFNPSLPPLESSERAKKQAKEAYKGLVMKGNVESQFLYATLLSTDLLPFGHLDYRLVVLPIEPSGNSYRLLRSNEASERGFTHLSAWLEKAQLEWKKRRGEKAEKMDIYGRLNQFRILSRQNPYVKYRVLYNTSGTYLTACAMEKDLIEFEIGSQKIKAMGFIADTKTYWFETDKPNEAHYLTALLNATFMDKEVKIMQTRGQFGPRDIHKKVLEFPIPQFDPSDSKHLRLAGLGKKCSQKVQQWIKSGGPGKIRSIGKLRSMVRKMLEEELKETDELVRYL